jgi:hypothetical protein
METILKHAQGLVYSFLVTVLTIAPSLDAWQNAQSNVKMPKVMSQCSKIKTLFVSFKLLSGRKVDVEML